MHPISTHDPDPTKKMYQSMKLTHEGIFFYFLGCMNPSYPNSDEFDQDFRLFVFSKRKDIAIDELSQKKSK